MRSKINVIVPFNIASYALLASILEGITGYEALAIEGNLKCVHFYDNQYEAAKELLTRDPLKHGNCRLATSAYISSKMLSVDELIREMKIFDFSLSGYTSDENIKVDMLAPKSI